MKKNKKHINGTHAVTWKKLEMCQYDTDTLIQRPSSPTRRHFALNQILPKSNLT